ncbi:MAG TPA: ATP-binding protein [Steroidobacter sp.]|nr:ATP-binding protein [Steroidobacteraceae bacterium]HLS82759.1 ATP-binding protein [Steroidobacter sp.]
MSAVEESRERRSSGAEAAPTAAPPRSLSTRLLVSVSILLITFFGLTIAALDLVFREVTDQAMRDRLEAHLLALIVASEEDAGDLVPATEKLDERLKNPGSGLYGEIMRADGYPSWRSNSLTGSGLTFDAQPHVGAREYGELRRGDGAPVRALSRSLAWQFDDGVTRVFVFSVAEDLQPYNAQLNRFRGQLFGWFGILLLLLLGALAMLLRRLLAPLRRIEREIEAIETGAADELGDGYPRELLGVTSKLNALLRSERERLARYRNTLGNLAHSFKTPLAVMRNLLHGAQGRDLPVIRQLDEQIGRMDDIVKYQLKRAAASGSGGLGAGRVDMREALEGLRAALLKVYAERNVVCELSVDDNVYFAGDREDLMEIAGNLLDNAFKWTRSRVQVTVSKICREGVRRDGLQLIVEDDGPGVPESERERVLERGARLDERVSGQGIGLSIVRELVELNGGSIAIGSSPALGGARIEVRLPPI